MSANPMNQHILMRRILSPILTPCGDRADVGGALRSSFYGSNDETKLIKIRKIILRKTIVCNNWTLFTTMNYAKMKLDRGSNAPLPAVAGSALRQVWSELYPCERKLWDDLYQHTKDMAKTLQGMFGKGTVTLGAHQLAYAEQEVERFISSMEIAFKSMTAAVPWELHTGCNECNIAILHKTLGHPEPANYRQSGMHPY